MCVEEGGGGGGGGFSLLDIKLMDQHHIRLSHTCKFCNYKNLIRHCARMATGKSPVKGYFSRDKVRPQ